MKNLLILALLAVGAWYAFVRLKQNPEVKKIQEAPVGYVQSLQNDVKKAQAARDIANEAIKKAGKELEKAASGDQ